MDNHKLGVIVPYRDRPTHLNEFKKRMAVYLEKRKINYEIFIIDQDHARQFNRGMLLNIGFKYALKNKCDYVVFHDIDMLPLSVDYSYSESPIHMATHFNLEPGANKREIFDQYFGGVTMFTAEDFIKINGYSNKYWGWGFEDDDLLLRCKFKDIDLDNLKIKNKGKRGKGLKFNGINSFVECQNIIDLNYDATFFISFYPENTVFDHTKESDEFTTFSIPGWDFATCYNSFSRYNFCAFDSNKQPYYINSEIKAPYKTNMTVVLNKNEKYFKVYQDGKLLGQTENFKNLFLYRKEPIFYLGVGKPNREKIPNFFRGTIDSFAYYDKILSDDEIELISNNDSHYLHESFKGYESKDSLRLYYDADFIENYELIDLTGGGVNGKIVNCEIIKQDFPDFVEIKIPHRRESVFKSLKHPENGFLGNKWKDQATRWNQLRFRNEVSLNDDLICGDGLSDLDFVEHGHSFENKIHHINVGI